MSGMRDRVKAEMPKVGRRRAVGDATRHHFHTRRKQWAKMTEEGRLQPLRDWAKAVKDQALNNNQQVVAKFQQSVEALGGHVHFAATAADCVRQVVEIATQHGAKLVVKSKSMATEEIHLNPALEAAGVETVETDLGEYIVQLAGEPPIHIVGPALHLTRYDVAELFEKELGEPMSTDPEALTAVARRVLRDKFLNADVGITGANAGIAETGTVVLFTNEGNGRMVTSLPRVMITVMGMEKVIGTWADFEPVLTLLPRSATGQNMTVYVSAVTGPRREGELDGPEELHVIVMDAGRSKLLGTEYQEALRCFRCGACLNCCPVFRQLGGHAYGTTYGGPIGITITPLMKGFVEHADLLDACSLCGACTEACAMQIPLHHLIRDLKAERAASAYTSGWERLLFRVWSWAWSSAGRFRWTGKLARLLAKPYTQDGYLTWHPGPLAAWGAERDFPAPAARSLRERWADLEREVNP
ncbi:MAG TPA: LutB/LldF family L-lactate oxidation iron-sulfur protein [Symbiobacteriaceae bacterium]|jgi:L-lactate dehydrogenase complex protein LldF